MSFGHERWWPRRLVIECLEAGKSQRILTEGPISSGHAPYLVQVFQCQDDLSAVQSDLLLFEMDPLHQVCEELSAIHVICNQSLASVFFKKQTGGVGGFPPLF